MQNFQSFSKIVCSLCISQIKQAMCINASIPVVSARFTDGIQMIYRGEQAYHNKSIYARTLAIIYPNISSAIKSTRFSAIFFKMEVVFVNSLIPSRPALSISGRIGMASFTNPAYLYLPLLYKLSAFCQLVQKISGKSSATYRNTFYLYCLLRVFAGASLTESILYWQSSVYTARYSSRYLLYTSANSFSSGQIRLKNDLILL